MRKEGDVRIKGEEERCFVWGGLAFSADSVFFGEAAAKSGSEKDGTRDGQTRTQEQPRVMSEAQTKRDRRVGLENRSLSRKYVRKRDFAV
jgi:hypothetical protein